MHLVQLVLFAFGNMSYASGNISTSKMGFMMMTEIAFVEAEKNDTLEELLISGGAYLPLNSSLQLLGT